MAHSASSAVALPAAPRAAPSPKRRRTGETASAAASAAASAHGEAPFAFADPEEGGAAQGVDAAGVPGALRIAPAVTQWHVQLGDTTRPFVHGLARLSRILRGRQDIVEMFVSSGAALPGAGRDSAGDGRALCGLTFVTSVRGAEVMWLKHAAMSVSIGVETPAPAATVPAAAAPDFVRLAVPVHELAQAVADGAAGAIELWQDVGSDDVHIAFVDTIAGGASVRVTSVALRDPAVLEFSALGQGAALDLSVTHEVHMMGDALRALLSAALKSAGASAAKASKAGVSGVADASLPSSKLVVHLALKGVQASTPAAGNATMMLRMAYGAADASAGKRGFSMTPLYALAPDYSAPVGYAGGARGPCVAWTAPPDAPVVGDGLTATQANGEVQDTGAGDGNGAAAEGDGALATFNMAAWDASALVFDAAYSFDVLQRVVQEGPLILRTTERRELVTTFGCSSTVLLHVLACMEEDSY